MERYASGTHGLRLEAGISPDKPREECGLFGIYSPQSNAKLAAICHLGLQALQHRGQESAGIAVSDFIEMKSHKDQGLVNEVFGEEELEKMSWDEARMAVGHVRYSTLGASTPVNAQPLVVNSAKGTMALAHNGNLLNAVRLRSELESRGSIFHSEVDTEVIAHLLARAEAKEVPDALQEILGKLKGGFSLIVVEGERLTGLRDPFGFRPLVIGKLDGAYILASETCALNTVGAEFVREVEPGEMVTFDEDGIHSEYYTNRGPEGRQALCIFEFVYFARPDSVLSGQTVHEVRKEIGRQLARESRIEADIVVPVPDSGISAALGFAEESGLPYRRGLIKNRYVGRTFIAPTQKMRDLRVRIKLNPIREVLSGCRVAVIDDSIVRGTTIELLIGMLSNIGTEKIDVYSASPAITHPCHYGIDTSYEKELIAAGNTVEEIRAQIGADSLNYLSLSGLISAVGLDRNQICTACFDGDYPIEPEPGGNRCG